MLGFAGVTATDFNTAAVTVSVVDPVTPSNIALITDEPTPTAVASPCDPGELEIVADDIVADAQVTDAVRSFVDLSE
jgi:hypothetical protein